MTARFVINKIPIVEYIEFLPLLVINYLQRNLILQTAAQHSRRYYINVHSHNKKPSIFISFIYIHDPRSHFTKPISF